MILGLTGSIAMGKSATAEMFKKLGYPVFDADNAVHDLYTKDGQAAKEIAEIYPDVIINGAVDRKVLIKKIADDQTILPQIEKIVHPLVRSLEKQFTQAHEKAGAKLVILDIPLLFEAGREKDVDIIVVVSANADLQRQRALERPGMTPEKLAMIIARQLPDKQKRARADYVIDTASSLDETFAEVKKLVKKLDPTNTRLANTELANSGLET